MECRRAQQPGTLCLPASPPTCALVPQEEQARECLAAAAAAPPDYVFPARPQELAILQHAVDAAPGDAR